MGSSREPRSEARRSWRRRLALPAALLLMALPAASLPSGSAAHAKGQPTIWSPGAPPLPSARSNMGSASGPCPAPNSAHACLYSIGGRAGGSQLTSVLAFDPANPGDGWTPAPALAQAVVSGAAMAGPCPGTNPDTCLYAVGGFGSGYQLLATVQVYDPEDANGTWSTSAAPALHDAAFDLAGTSGPCPAPSTDTCLYAVAGQPTYGEVQIYDPKAPAQQWVVSSSSLEQGRTSPAAVSAPCPAAGTGPVPGTDTCIYVLGGLYITPRAEVEIFDPALPNAGWQYAAPLTFASHSLAAVNAPCPDVPADTCIWALSGHGGAGNQAWNAVQVFDPSVPSASWSAAVPQLAINVETAGAGAAPCAPPLTGTCPYVYGGYGGFDNNTQQSATQELVPDTATPAALTCPTATDLTNALATANSITITCAQPDTLTFSTPLTFYTPATIDASASPAPITLASGGQSRLITTATAAPLTLDGLHLTAGASDPSSSDVSILAESSLTLLNSTLTSIPGSTNADTVSEQGGYSSVAPTLSVSHSTVTGNVAASILADVEFALLTVTNSTITGNTAGADAFYLFAVSGAITNSTISNNASGTVLHLVARDTVSVGNTILAGNTGANCGGTPTDLGSNLLDTASCGMTNGVNGDIVGVSPDLGSLAANGGPTPTEALLAGSPAIGAGSTALCAAGGSLDQRGYLRHTNTCDIGAFETGARPDQNDLPASGPGITNLYPNSVTAGSGDTTLTIEGQGFAGGDTVSIGGSTYTPTVVSSRVLTVQVLSADLSVAAVKEVQVFDAGSDRSNQLPLYVTAQADTVSSFTSNSSTATTGGTGAATAGSLTATQTGGDGPIQVAQYTGNPATVTLDKGQDYFDVHVDGSNLPTAVTITDCTPGDQTLLWSNPTYGQWGRVSNLTAGNGCLVATLDSTTSPSIQDLSGAIFGGSTSSSPTRALVAAAGVSRQGTTRILHWRMANQGGVAGYRIFGGRHLLTRRLIPAHASPRYSYRTTLAGPYRLQVVMRNGTASSIPVR